MKFVDLGQCKKTKEKEKDRKKIEYNRGSDCIVHSNIEVLDLMFLFVYLYVCACVI